MFNCLKLGPTYFGFNMKNKTDKLCNSLPMIKVLNGVIVNHKKTCDWRDNVYF